MTGEGARAMAADGLEITWFGHAMFTVAGGGVTVACDPVPPEVGYLFGKVAADLVLITHEHFDHNYLDGIQGSPRVQRSSGELTFGGVEVEGIDTFHDARGGKERGANVIYSWRQAGFRLAHLGDLGEWPGAGVLERLYDLDIMMVPVGGVFTIDAEQAVKLVAELAPSIVLPMHYGTPVSSVPVDPLDPFIAAFPGTVRDVPERPLALGRDLVPAETEVWVVPYQ